MDLSFLPEELVKEVEFALEAGYSFVSFPVKAGYILPDGSILEIGSDDHSLINRALWEKYNLITYRLISGGYDVEIRMFMPITQAQVRVLRNFIKKSPVLDVWLNVVRNGSEVRYRFSPEEAIGALRNPDAL